MKKVALFLAEGFEEVEAVTPIDLLRRAGLEVDVIGVGSKIVKGARGVSVSADYSLDSVKTNYDCLIIPGGMPGALNLSKSAKLNKIIVNHNNNKALIAGICAAPVVVLAPLGILNNKTYTCYPGFEKKCEHGRFVADNVVKSENIITSRGAGTAILFSLKIVESLLGLEVSDNISKSIVFS